MRAYYIICSNEIEYIMHNHNWNDIKQVYTNVIIFLMLHDLSS